MGIEISSSYFNFSST